MKGSEAALAKTHSDTYKQEEAIVKRCKKTLINDKILFDFERDRRNVMRLVDESIY